MSELFEKRTRQDGTTENLDSDHRIEDAEAAANAQRRLLWLFFGAAALLSAGLIGYQLYLANAVSGMTIAVATAVIWTALAHRGMGWTADVAMIVLTGSAALALLLTRTLIPPLFAIAFVLAAWHLDDLLRVTKETETPALQSIAARDLLWLAGIALASLLLTFIAQRLYVRLPFLGGLALGAVLLGTVALLVRNAFGPQKT